MALIRHKNTATELDVPDEAVAYFPDYERVDAAVVDDDGNDDRGENFVSHFEHSDDA